MDIYVRNPQEVNAIQWTGKNAQKVIEFFYGKGTVKNTSENKAKFKYFEKTGKIEFYQKELPTLVIFKDDYLVKDLGKEDDYPLRISKQIFESSFTKKVEENVSN
ncbi:hypothetical protein [Flammeovirga agarivorans]|uniref:Uncharacterized protein n=1 Tax=Flammeovirga agarivorans TaxID=2726742 RepID=A0A7X8SRH4_9BACT|nr:hypothetical protein [Flammeovirga agarivorans]NLR94912.1 hypothetical protein [Flammeovirga agarivorans]